MRSAVALALALVGLVFASPALGATQRGNFDAWAYGVRVALETWGGEPPCGTPTFVRVPDSSADGGIVRDGTMGAEMYADPSTCSIEYASRALQETPPAICAAIVHEYGHLWGHDHSTDPTNVMYPVPQRAKVPGCGADCMTSRYGQPHEAPPRPRHRGSVVVVQLEARMLGGERVRPNP
jgi:hypothetical protein